MAPGRHLRSGKSMPHLRSGLGNRPLTNEPDEGSRPLDNITEDAELMPRDNSHDTKTSKSSMNNDSHSSTAPSTSPLQPTKPNNNTSASPKPEKEKRRTLFWTPGSRLNVIMEENKSSNTNASKPRSSSPFTNDWIPKEPPFQNIEALQSDTPSIIANGIHNFIMQNPTKDVPHKYKRQLMILLKSYQELLDNEVKLKETMKDLIRKNVGLQRAFEAEQEKQVEIKELYCTEIKRIEIEMATKHGLEEVTLLRTNTLLNKEERVRPSRRHLVTEGGEVIPGPSVVVTKKDEDDDVRRAPAANIVTTETRNTKPSSFLGLKLKGKGTEIGKENAAPRHDDGHQSEPERSASRPMSFFEGDDASISGVRFAPRPIDSVGGGSAGAAGVEGDVRRRRSKSHSAADGKIPVVKKDDE